MKLLLHNVFEGCNDPGRFIKLINYIRRQNPDVLGLNELNNWDADNSAKLNRFLKDTGFPYYVFCKSKSGFNMAIFSKFPLENHKILSKGFRTGAAIAELKTPEGVFTIAITHLHYKNEALRLRELQLLQNELKNRKNVIVMGDLNSLSPHDISDKEKLLIFMREKGITKFGSNKLQTSVITKLLTDKYVDALRHMSQKHEYSVPTRVNTDQDHFMRLRLDYIFISKDLKKNLRQAEILRNRTTHTLSDHFPMMVQIAA